jgi:hypothetical protein
LLINYDIGIAFASLEKLKSYKEKKPARAGFLI